MGLEKKGLKGRGGSVGGFFQLFDWNGKSRKKLFSDGFALPEGSKQGKRSDENLPTTRIRLFEEYETLGASSTKGSSDYSCASSTTDGEGSGTRAPGVVARLMGLDSLPTSSVSEPYSTPVFDSRPLRDTHDYRKNLELYKDNQNKNSNKKPDKVEGFSRKPLELRPKLHTKPIEKYQIESLPPKSAKSIPITHHKLLSPIKNPGFVSSKSAAHLMETAAKILEPRIQCGTMGKIPSLGPSSIPMKIRDLKDNISTSTSQKRSRLPEASRRPVESSAVKHLNGQSLSKSWNGSEESNSIGLESKGKSISLAVQAKVNVQRREGLNSSSRSLSIQEEHDEFKLNQPFKSQPNTQKNKQKRLPTPIASGVLRQNNQKQNCSSKDKIHSKSSASNQPGRKAVSGDSSIGQNKTFSKVSVNTKVGYKKEEFERIDLEKEAPLSRTKNFPRKKRAIESGVINNVLVGRDQKLFQPNVAIDEHRKWSEDNRREVMDVVSFTFNSPMIKSMPGSQSSGQMLEKLDPNNGYSIDSDGEKNGTGAKSRKLSSTGVNLIGGDALSILLEQKLRELTSGVELSCCSVVKAGPVTTPSILQDLVSALDNVCATSWDHHKRPLFGPDQDKLGSTYDSGCSSTNGLVLKMKPKSQGAEGITDRSSDAWKQLDCQNPSPVSILEATFSSESCNSYESWDTTNGSKLLSSVQAQKSCTPSWGPKKSPSLEAETELSDSASSSLTETLYIEHTAESSVTRCRLREERQELEYVRAILHSAAPMFKHFTLGHASQIIDPLIFDSLEIQKIGSISEGDDKDSCIRRKSLFDCVGECMDSKCRRYICGSYRDWAKGVAVVGSKGLAEEVYKEILGWRSMGDWMVDDLVERDMSTQLGKLVGYETELFEVGVEIEREILCSMVDQAVVDMLVC